MNDFPQLAALGSKTTQSQPAATQWFKWSPDSVIGPDIGEWCLWTMVINGRRNYFSGSLFNLDDKVYLSWNGGMSVKPDDTTYWARVNFINEQPND